MIVCVCVCASENAGNGLGPEAGKAIGAALESNKTLNSLNLSGEDG